jgi:molybdenum-dependent DNA-binding transcriptional regulator ModE
LKAISSAAGAEISGGAQKGDTGEEAIARWLALVDRFEEVRKDLQRVELELEKDDQLKRRFEEEALGLRASSLKREAEAAWRLGQVVGDEKQRA